MAGDAALGSGHAGGPHRRRVAEWNRRIEAAGPFEENGLRAWLELQDVHGYPQGMLVMEQFGYPDFLVATSDQLVDAQYADRPALLEVEATGRLIPAKRIGNGAMPVRIALTSADEVDDLMARSYRENS